MSRLKIITEQRPDFIQKLNVTIISFFFPNLSPMGITIRPSNFYKIIKILE